MIVIGYHLSEMAYGRKYRRVTDPEQAQAIRVMSRRSHVTNEDIAAFAQLNVFFHEDGHPYPEGDGDTAAWTHMRPVGDDGATQ